MTIYYIFMHQGEGKWRNEILIMSWVKSGLFGQLLPLIWEGDLRGGGREGGGVGGGGDLYAS